jgi:acetyltransferase
MLAGAGPLEYEKALDALLADDGVDLVITIFVPPLMIEPEGVVRKIIEVEERYDKPVLCVLMAEERFLEELPRRFRKVPPFYRFPESAVRVAAEMCQYHRWYSRPQGKIKTFPIEIEPVREIICKHQNTGGGFLPPTEVFKVLEDYGFPVCKSVIVSRGEDLIEAAGKIGYPLVLKVYGEKIIHKSDIGGVAVDIKTSEELLEARSNMEDRCKAAGMLGNVSGFVIQEMADPGGKEVILGMTVDEKFGPLVMFGMGGKYVEIVKDITIRVMPVTDIDAQEMVKEIKSYPLLEGVRGEERVDIELLVESIQRLAQLINDIHCLRELDINPFIVTPEREHCKIVDARIRVAEQDVY